MFKSNILKHLLHTSMICMLVFTITLPSSNSAGADALQRLNEQIEEIQLSNFLTDSIESGAYKSTKVKYTNDITCKINFINNNHFVVTTGNKTTGEEKIYDSLSNTFGVVQQTCNACLLNSFDNFLYMIYLLFL